MDYLTDIPEIDEQLQQRFKLLTPRVQELISSDKVENLVESLTKAFALSQDEHDGLIHEIILVLFSIEPIKEFELRLATEVLMPIEKIPEISQSIYKHVFLSVWDDIQPEAAPQQAEDSAPAMAPTAAPQEKPVVGYQTFTEQRAGTQPEGAFGETPVTQQGSAVPQYQKPLTDMPRYRNNDPYHEPIE